MKPWLVVAITCSLVACVHRETTPRDPTDFGNWLGQSTASAPSDPTQPLAKDPDVTEGGGTLRAFVGTGGGGVTPTVGEQPDTLAQARGPTTTDTSGGQPGTIYAPALAPPVAIAPPITNAPPVTIVPSTPVSGPITGAGPNGPGTGVGPATSTGPGTSRVTPPPTPSGATAPPVSTPGPR